MFQVVEEIPNRRIRLLKLNESVSLSQNIRPACLPRPQYTISHELTEMCWVDNCSWFSKMKLNIVSNKSCNTNTLYSKSVRFDGVDEKTINICVNVLEGDKDVCYVRNRRQLH